MKPEIKSNNKKPGKRNQKGFNKSMEEHYSDSHFSAGHLSYLDNLYETFLDNPDVISKDWKDLFVSLSDADDFKEDILYSEVVDSFKNKLRKRQNNSKEFKKISNGDYQKTLPLTVHGKVNYYIDSYRSFGHTAANLDPLGLAQKNIHVDLIYAEKLLENISLEERVGNDYPKGSKNKIFLKELKQSITDKYSDTIGLEFSHLSDERERNWIIDRFENSDYKKIKLDKKIYILKRLISARGLAKYLSAKYPGMKRFGIDGCESLIPLIDSLID